MSNEQATMHLHTGDHVRVNGGRGTMEMVEGTETTRWQSVNS